MFGVAQSESWHRLILHQELNAALQAVKLSVATRQIVADLVKISMSQISYQLHEQKRDWPMSIYVPFWLLAWQGIRDTTGNVHKAL